MLYSITISFYTGTKGGEDYCAYRMIDQISGSSNAFSAIDAYKKRILAKYADAKIYEVECITLDATN